MQTFHSYKQAKEAADEFFLENFGYRKGASFFSKKTIDEKGNLIVDFYSIDDPAMDDTFKAKIIINEESKAST